MEEFTGVTSSFNNGTGFLVRSADRLFAVTADHVVQHFLEVTSTDGLAACQFGDLSVTLADRVIARDSARDLATLHIDEQELPILAASGFSKVPLTFWPPASPQKNTAFVMTGYPGAERQVVSPDHLSFGIYGCSSFIDSVHDLQFRSGLDFDRSVVTFPLDAEMPDKIEFAGMSGGPALAIVNPEGLMYLRLVGVVSEGSPHLRICELARADAIQSDGSISPA